MIVKAGFTYKLGIKGYSSVEFPCHVEEEVDQTKCEWKQVWECLQEDCRELSEKVRDKWIADNPDLVAGEKTENPKHSKFAEDVKETLDILIKQSRDSETPEPDMFSAFSKVFNETKSEKQKNMTFAKTGDVYNAYWTGKGLKELKTHINSKEEDDGKDKD